MDTRSDILRGNYLFRVIELPEGKHKVEMSFDSFPIKLGMAVSSFVVVLFLLFLFWSLLLQRVLEAVPPKRDGFPQARRMSLDRHKKAVALAVFSAGVYLCLRLAFHAQLQGAGYVDGGLISYDSYYHFAFARELNRTAGSLLFQNPFGTLDQKPLLFNLYSSLLSLVPPLSIPTLFIFDCAVGALFIGLTSLCISCSCPPSEPLRTWRCYLGEVLPSSGCFSAAFQSPMRCLQLTGD